MSSSGFLLLTIAVLLAPRESRAENSLVNTEWTLTSYGAASDQSPAIKETTVTLKFETGHRAGGTGGCNSYGAEYTAEAEQLSFRHIISTKKACLDTKVMEQELRYFEALNSAGRFKIVDSRLTVFYDGARGALNFMKAPSAPSADRKYENPSNPVSLLASYYNAVNRKDYKRAFGYWENADQEFSTKPDEDRVRETVERFGRRLQNVSILAPREIAAKSIQQQYAGLVSAELLRRWSNDPARAPGRTVSSPWPDRIEIASTAQTDDNRYIVEGNEIEVTSAEVTRGGAAISRPVKITVERINGDWVIAGYARLTSTTKR